VTYWWRPKSDALYKTRLANFVATILLERAYDDGADVQKLLTVSGLGEGGVSFPQINIPGDEFSTMQWPLIRWGVRAVVSAGIPREHLRAAIQELSKDRCRSVSIFAHTGSRLIGDRCLYLHSGGAIGADGNDTTIQVEFPDPKFRDFELLLPENTERAREAISASLRLLEIGLGPLAFVMLASTYRAPLGMFVAIDHGIWLEGPSGVFKTEVAALAQAHFGQRFHGKNLPGSWSSTGNALERQAFVAKDVLLVIDDLAPQSNRHDNSRRNRDVDRIFRGVGNQAGRSRMAADGTLRPVYFPRGMVLATGEDLPRGHSVKARLLICSVGRGDVRVDVLTQLQQFAREGLFCTAMGGFVRFLCGSADELKHRLPVRYAELRAVWSERARKVHARTPDIGASLQLGLEMLIEYGVQIGALTSKDAATLVENGVGALSICLNRQSEHQRNDEPAERFLALLGGAITAGKAHLATPGDGTAPENPVRWGWSIEQSATGEDAVGGRLRPGGDKVGWVDAKHVYLHAEAAYAAAQAMANRQGEVLSVSAQALWKRLIERGFALRNEPDHNQVKRTIEGSQMRVVMLTRPDILLNPCGLDADNDDSTVIL
jgi:hypothetical protein